MPRQKLVEEGLSISYGNGITVTTSSFSISLDPRSASSCDYTFVSHAHIDHVHSPNGKSKIIASEETKELAKLRGYELGKVIEGASGIELIDSGHILGSRAVLIKDRVLYTGDLCSRDRAFLKGFRGIKCDTLIVESTYGRGHYRFPTTEQIVSEVNKFISQSFDRCRPVVLTGYALGKAQLLSYLFDMWEPLFAYDSVSKLNRCHIKLGVPLKDIEQFSSSDKFQERAERGPWVLIAPSGGRSNFIRALKHKFNAVVASFSGWALDTRYRYAMGLDRGFPMSDHCDFSELVDFVKRCNPSKVYTVHGFSEEFAAHLNRMGFDAEPLENPSGEEAQSKLTSFAR